MSNTLTSLFKSIMTLSQIFVDIYVIVNFSLPSCSKVGDNVMHSVNTGLFPRMSAKSWRPEWWLLWETWLKYCAVTLATLWENLFPAASHFFWEPRALSCVWKLGEEFCVFTKCFSFFLYSHSTHWNSYAFYRGFFSRHRHITRPQHIFW